MVLALWSVVGCGPLGFGRDSAGETGWSRSGDSGAVSTTVWTGPLVGGGLGATLVAVDDGAWAGAPWGGAGQVWALQSQAVAVFPDETDSPGLGLGLAVDPDGVLAAGAPLVGAGAGRVLRTDGGGWDGAAGELAGARLAWHRGTLWSGGGTRLSLGDSTVELPERLGDLLDFDGQPAIGLPRGPDALWLNGKTWARPLAHDQAGFSLCAADFDGDGALDLAVGAPGADQVRLLLGPPAGWSLDDRVIQGPPGRFGHALACSEGSLVVGAPLAQGGVGAVWLLVGDALDQAIGEPWAVGLAPGDHFGAAVALTEGDVWVGSPMAQDLAGQVVRLSR